MTIQAPQKSPRFSYYFIVQVLLFVFHIPVYGKEFTPEGLWVSDGYGYFIDVGASSINLKEITSISCLPSSYNVVKESVEKDGSWRLSAQGDPAVGYLVPVSTSSMLLKRSGIASDIIFRRVQHQPVVCNKPLEDTPQSNFDVLWTTYKEHYPLFELKKME